MARPAPHAAVAAAVDAGATAPVAPADAAPPDPCGGYAVAVAPVLGRIARSAQAFLDRLGTAKKATEVVTAAGALASALEGERPALDAIHSGAADLDGAHARLTVALTALAAAVRDLGASYGDATRAAARDAASKRLNGALHEWADAVHGIQAVCPGLQ